MADREDERDIEVRKTKIPSIRLNKSLLEDLVEIIEKQYTDIKKQNESGYPSVTYTLEEKDGEIKSGNPTKFLRHDISPDLRSIFMRLYSKDKQITIRIDLSHYSPYSYTEVEGRDSTWVNGISTLLTKLFDNHKYKARNDFFLSKKSLIISLPIGIVIGILYFISISDPLGKAINLIFWPIIIPVNFHFWFLPWLYPKVETEHSKSVKFRKKILTALTALGISLLGSYIWQYLPH